MSSEAKQDKWLEDAAHEVLGTLISPLKDGWTEVAHEAVVDAIARHFAARERDVQELVKWAQAACIVVVRLHLVPSWGISPPIRNELARLADTSVAALAPFTAPAASHGEEQ